MDNDVNDDDRPGVSELAAGSGDEGPAGACVTTAIPAARPVRCGFLPAMGQGSRRHPVSRPLSGARVRMPT